MRWTNDLSWSKAASLVISPLLTHPCNLLMWVASVANCEESEGAAHFRCISPQGCCCHLPPTCHQCTQAGSRSFPSSSFSQKLMPGFHGSVQGAWEGFGGWFLEHGGGQPAASSSDVPVAAASDAQMSTGMSLPPLPFDLSRLANIAI